MEHYRSGLEDLFCRLQSSPAGLCDQEAARRLAEQGPNELQMPSQVHPLQILFNQFKSFIIYILLFAVVASLLIGEYVDTLIILAILLANAAIGYYQELGAKRSLEALKRISTLQARVLRAGRILQLPARELVAGDLIELQAGDRVPADVRIVEAVRLQAEEAALTGESLPVDKHAEVIAGEVPLGDRRNLLFSATTVVAGHGRGLVVATGMGTELGKIASMTLAAEPDLTPLQRRLDQFGKKLGYVIIAICLLVFVLSLTNQYIAGPLSLQSLVAFGFIAISLAVAAVPTALPAVVTIALSIGVKRLLAKQALVRNLAAVETLGSCDVICTDKTGTLTENRMLVCRAWSLDGEARLGGSGYLPQGEVEGPCALEVFVCGQACNNASLVQDQGEWRVVGNPTEAALLVSAAKAGIQSRFQRRDERPFDSARKLMSVCGSLDGEEMVFAKGALDQLLACCSKVWMSGGELDLTAEPRARIEAQHASYAAEALRVLAFASKTTAPGAAWSETDLTFLGLQAMRDPPRPDVVEALAKTRRAGIRVIIITGDYGETARAIGRELGIEGEALSGAELEQLDETALAQALRSQTNIFSRVAPEHKLRIVTALQQLGHTVAMTGDGVNDAPALKKADIGVAVGSGTEVAKDASDFVLLDDSFSHIVNAIEEGRGIYDNIQKSIMLLLSGNLGEVLIIFLAVMLGMNLPLTAILLLWINLVTDGAPALAYSVDPYGRHLMLRPPKPRSEGILPVPKLTLLAVLGSVGTALALLLFAHFGGGSADPEVLARAQTLVFNFVVLYEVVLSFVIRAGYRVPLLSNPWVWGAAGLAIALQALLMYTPLAGVFRIVPLAPAELGLLLLAGALFALAALGYQRLADCWRASSPAPANPLL